MDKETKKIEIPDSWDEVTVEKYQEIMSMDEDVNRTNNIISILLDEDVEVVKNLTRDSLTTIMEHLVWTNTLPDEKTYRREITVCGRKLYLVDLNEITIGQWIDLMYYRKERIKNLNRTFAILYRDADGKIPKDGDELMKQASIGELYGAIVFFSLIANRSIENTQTYLFTESLSQRTTQK